MKRFLTFSIFNIVFSFMLIPALLSCSSNEDKHDEDIVYLHTNVRLNPYERLISASFDDWGNYSYLVQIEYQPHIKIAYNYSRDGKLLNRVTYVEHYPTVPSSTALSDSINKVRNDIRPKIDKVLANVKGRDLTKEERQTLDSLDAIAHPDFPETLKDWEKQEIEKYIKNKNKK